jgi:hypothetical protein
MMPAVPHRMILDEKLRCDGSTKTKRKRRSTIQIVICETTYGASGLTTVLA